MRTKHALLSPAVNAMQGMPSEEAVRASFEQQFGQMAYEAFSGKFPDLVNDLVTFKILDSNLEDNVGTGAFILEHGGDFIYIPAVLSDNQLKPFDLMYVKSKDIFLPLSREWLDETAKVGLSSMGEGVKLPKTVATDVDIRNIIVPPTTGRYSYASADISPASRFHAEASAPLGMRLTKAAAEGDSNVQYNPELWASFVDQFSKLQQMTPGQALDSGTLDLDTLSKMYKSHLKTWEMGSAPQADMAAPMPAPAGAPASMGYAPVGANGAMPLQGAAPGMSSLPKMASVKNLRRSHDAGRAMLKHAMSSTSHSQNLIKFLTNAPNNVKLGFAKVLDKNPRLLKKAARLYNVNDLLSALRPTKTAGEISRSGGLYIADASTPAPELATSFGSAAPEAFNGILLRGYYFKDTRPQLNLAMQVQEYHDFHDAQEPGVYRIYNTRGEPKAGLVFTEPTDLLGEVRSTFPNSESRVKLVRTRVQSTQNQLEPHELPIEALRNAPPDVARSHQIKRLVVFPDGNYICSNSVMGEQVTEAALKNSDLYTRLMRDGVASPSKGLGMFAFKRGTHYLGTCPVEISSLSVGSDGVTRGKLTSTGGMLQRDFVIDTRSPGNRPRIIRDTNLVIIPGNWKWIPLNKEIDSSDFLMTGSGISRIVLDALGSMGAHSIVARRAGESMYALNGGPTMSKNAALRLLATNYAIHAADAEAILKIAEDTNVCRAYALSTTKTAALVERVKIAQGAAVPATPMGAPPAMAPAPGPSPVDQAFQETSSSVQQQIDQLMGQLSVLQSVQQRAQQIQQAQQGGVPMQGMDPNAAVSAPDMSQPPMDASMMSGGMPNQASPAPMDPNAMGGPQGQAPMGAVMPSEGPSSGEIAQQVNPAFLDSAAAFQDAGAFDAGAIASLTQDPSLKRIGSEYAADLENSVDDLGRTLLTLYMQEPQLKDQMGDKAYVDLETQLRDTFRGLGSLVLTLSKNTVMLPQNATA